LFAIAESGCRRRHVATLTAAMRVVQKLLRTDLKKIPTHARCPCPS
jgi:hypothetical protein